MILTLLFSFPFQGGKLVYLYTKKRGSVPKCGDCKKKLQGVRTYEIYYNFLFQSGFWMHYLSYPNTKC